MHFSTEVKEQIFAASKLSEVIEDFHTLTGTNTTKYCKCPMCGKSGKGKGLSVSLKKDIAKCFSCGESFSSATDFLMKTQNMEYPDALKYLADKYNIVPMKQKAKFKGASFCEKQLKGSGLTRSDVLMNTVSDQGNIVQKYAFTSGSRDDFGNTIEGDDMIVHYYDLNGKLCRYQKKNSKKMLPFIRFRWAHPTDKKHLDKNNKPKKYESPWGASGAFIYIPEKLRQAYQRGVSIPRLFIQEGEKKAEKATKHGMYSFGIPGINMLGYNNSLPDAVRYVIERCNVKEVVFIMDSDYKELSQNLTINKDVSQRAYSFYSAAKNFKEYMYTLKNRNVYIECYLVAGRSTENKGIDDLMVAHKGNEEEITKSLDFAINEKSGESEHFQSYKITEYSDTKLKEIWGLQSAANFAEAHRETLIELPEFIIKNHRWKFNENGEFVSAQPIEDYEQFWEFEPKLNREGVQIGETLKFDYENLYNFLMNRGYARIPVLGGNYGAKHDRYEFAHVTNKIVKMVDPHQIRDFVIDFAKEIAPKAVRNMMYRGGKMYLGPDSLSYIGWQYPTFKRAGRDFQYFLFKDQMWKITEDEITTTDYNDLKDYIWEDSILKVSTEYIPDLVRIGVYTDEDIAAKPEKDREIWKNFLGKRHVEITKTGKNNPWVKFLWNTSDFYWKEHVMLSPSGDKFKMVKKATDKREPYMYYETEAHFLSKMTGIGYLLHTYFDSSNPKAVIGMDGKMSEVGQSNGGSGKSLVGESLRELVPTVVIAAKNRKLTEDQFLFEEVNEKTQVVFLDDVRANLDFEFFFPYITGTFVVNAKGEKKFTIPRQETPKFYIPTNHAIRGNDDSSKRRQYIFAFSDYYNAKHKPIDDFGKRFFTEWDKKERDEFYSFMAFCVQAFLKYGLVEGPSERIEKRKLRQSIGESMLSWADSYYRYDENTGKFEGFDMGNEKINRQIARRELYEDLMSNYPEVRKYISNTSFKERLKSWCTFREATFNPSRIKEPHQEHGGDIKKGGVEYFVIKPKEIIKPEEPETQEDDGQEDSPF